MFHCIGLFLISGKWKAQNTQVIIVACEAESSIGLILVIDEPH